VIEAIFFLTFFALRVISFIYVIFPIERGGRSFRWKKNRVTRVFERIFPIFSSLTKKKLLEIEGRRKQEESKES